ncbi:uncharacterized protein [Rutidosis leptorrhynchoides]|uniref:uncharacterized protein n=1 Tax=Rutidosis leptorrhynchoides TaxID=125765 RepID=UPI003A99E534
MAGVYPDANAAVYELGIFSYGDVHRPIEYRDKSVYSDPAYDVTKSLSHKSDVFSFGVVLFEVLFGREASTYYTPPPNDDEDHWYFARLARQHHEEKRLDDMIDPGLRKQMNQESLGIFSETAYFCLKELRSQLPYINQVVRKLEKALELQQIHDQTLEHFTASAVESRISGHLKRRCGLNMCKLKIKDFVFMSAATNSSAIEANNEGEFPRIRSTVAIKRIFRREDMQGEQGFIREIEMLSKCKHPSVVSLLGYCDEGAEMILIYEYASNGSLENYLGNPNNLTNLTWSQRIQICLDIAHGLSYLHSKTEEKEMIIHRDMKSANVLLDGNWVAKIADFGLSKLALKGQQGSALVTEHIAGTNLYLDPEYNKTVLFEVLCGRLAYDSSYVGGLPLTVAGQAFNMERLKKMVDPKLMEADANIIQITGGLDQDSLETFIAIAYQCLAETQALRPKIEVIIKELEKSLDSQKNGKENLRMSLNEIELATKNFSESNCIGSGRFWKLYEGEVPYDNGCNTIIVKRWDSKNDPKHHREFLTELELLLKYKHECIIGLAGFCNEMAEKIIVYEHRYNGILNKHLNNVRLTWTKRLKIGIDVAKGLKFLHSGCGEESHPMKHRDIKSASILLNSNFKAKIANLELCIYNWQNENAKQSSSDHAYSSLGYNDPNANFYITKKFDIYSLGVVLIEMMCGRSALQDHTQSLVPLSKRHFDEGNLDEMIFGCIKEQIVPESLATFQKIALQCLNLNEDDRPLAKEVVVQPEAYQKLGVQPVDNNEKHKLVKVLSQSETISKKFHIIPANMILSDPCNAKCFVLKSLRESRFAF